MEAFLFPGFTVANSKSEAEILVLRGVDLLLLRCYAEVFRLAVAGWA